jgi:hypothetical protein
VQSSKIVGVALNCMLASFPDVDAKALCILKESHESEIHVEVLMAVKQGQAGAVGYKIDIDSAEAFDQDGVFEYP